MGVFLICINGSKVNISMLLFRCLSKECWQERVTEQPQQVSGLSRQLYKPLNYYRVFSKNLPKLFSWCYCDKSWRSKNYCDHRSLNLKFHSHENIFCFSKIPSLHGERFWVLQLGSAIGHLFAFSRSTYHGIFHPSRSHIHWLWRM